MKRKQILEILHPESVALFCDGFDDCIVGLASRFDLEPVVAYDYNKVISKLRKRDRMTEEDAVEYFNVNIIGAWVGNGTPIFVQTK